ncbi:MAG: LysM peptidoglycan-binding domain-containing protein [Rhodobacteraceae bacterium]|nr:LysM peptidoglycan-binding domain-containing protein [Paracoccaceae bacterium]
MAADVRAKPALRLVAVAAGSLALAACDENRNIDFDLRRATGGFHTADAVEQPVAPRPQADARGVISYPTYQVAVARRGDTVDSVAQRVGLPVDELARFNGLSPGMSLRDGEIVALPRRVSEPAGGFAGGSGIASAPLPSAPGGQVDVTTLAGSAIDRASAARPGAATPSGTIAPAQGSNEPVRHQVVRGETAYSIARLYGISVRALADWNGLGPDLNVREGSYLIIPQASAPAPAATPTAAATPAPVPPTTLPGQGSPTPVPPSAAEPLPTEDETGAVQNAPPSPNLEAQRTAASTRARLAMPVSGSIIRAYQKGRNEGIDISAAAGSDVKAAADGTVAAVTRSTDNVSIVIVRHDGAPFGQSEPILTVYANLEGIAVERGARVSRGQTLGKVRAGNPAFIRFEVRRGFETLDPSQFLD